MKSFIRERHKIDKAMDFGEFICAIRMIRFIPNTPLMTDHRRDDEDWRWNGN